MAWTFAEIAEYWRRHCQYRSTGATCAVRESGERCATDLTVWLTGPARGWHGACESWARGIPAWDAADSSEVREILGAMTDHQRRMAELHLECARAVREITRPQSAPLSSPIELSAEEERRLLTALSSLAVQYAGLGPHLGPAFLYDLAHGYLSGVRAGATAVRSVRFPLVRVGPSLPGEPVLPLAQFRLEGMPASRPAGAVYLAPAQAFTPIDESFYRIFLDAPKALRICGLLPETAVAVRVSIEWFHAADSVQDRLIRGGMSGGSGGGALALGLWCLWMDTYLEPGLVTSFALIDPALLPATACADGRCYRIGGDFSKARSIAESKGGAGIFLVSADQSDSLPEYAREIGLAVKRAGTLQEARDAGVGVGRYIEKRLKLLEENRRLYAPLAGNANRKRAEGDMPTDHRLWVTRPEAGGETREHIRDRIVDLRDLLNHTGCCVLVGAPGGGKTFTLEAIERIALERYVSELSPRIPVFLRLDGWEAAVGGSPRERLKAFVLSQAKELERLFDAYLDSGRFLFLCDALNQIAGYGSSREPDRHLREWIEQFGEPEVDAPIAPEDAKCRFIFSCRIENYQVSLPARRVDVEALDNERIALMAGKYLGDAAPAFLKALRDRGVWDLCFNPMVLGMFIRVQQSINDVPAHDATRSGQELPANLGELFRVVRELIIEREMADGRCSPDERDVVETGLKALAYAWTSDDHGKGARTEGTRSEAVAAMTEALESKADADTALSTAQNLTFVQIEPVHRDERPLAAVRFSHHRWQEFWAALQLWLETEPGGAALDWERVLTRAPEERSRQELELGTYDPLPPPSPTDWEQPVLMLAGFHRRTHVLLRQILERNPVLAARCLYDGRAVADAETRAAVVNALNSMLSRRNSGAGVMGLQARIAAGDALGELGYIGARLVETRDGPIFPEMVEIVASGEIRSFVMGSTKKNLRDLERRLGARWDDSWAEDEQPAYRVELDAYRIGKYPVTWREFGRFVQDDGYKNEEYWSEAGLEWLRSSGATAPRLANDPIFDRPSSPVVGVCWYEAEAYCRWLSEQEGSPRPYHLPTEAQWEYAARGLDGRLWPWGNDWPVEDEAQYYFNGALGSAYAGRTTSVGMFTWGATKEGVFDLVGNVWEWCGDWYAGYDGGETVRNPVGPEDGDTRVRRVLRGASWDGDHPDFFRAANRNGDDPLYWGDLVGFRVASGPP